MSVVVLLLVYVVVVCVKVVVVLGSALLEAAGARQGPRRLSAQVAVVVGCLLHPQTVAAAKEPMLVQPALEARAVAVAMEKPQVMSRIQVRLSIRGALLPAAEGRAEWLGLVCQDPMKQRHLVRNFSVAQNLLPPR